MESVKSICEDKMKKALGALKDEFNGLRTGRASPALLDKIRVDYYGQKTPLTQVATVSVPEARLIVIQPWDRSMIGEIEKGIQKSELSLNPSNDGKVIRIAIPPLTEERRKDWPRWQSRWRNNQGFQFVMSDGMDWKRLKNSLRPEGGRRYDQKRRR